MLDLLTDADLLKRAVAQFEQDTRESKYFSLLPPEAKPPLDLNRAVMEQFRPQMRKLYTGKTVGFR
jgi:aminobenzoyl-glutamate utilization protein B